MELKDLLGQLKALVVKIEAAIGEDAPAEEEAPEMEAAEGEESEEGGLEDGKKNALVAMMKKKYGG
jgi:hypothetical protein